MDGGRKIPRHVGIIMDGNGRWATERGLPRIEGHKRGVEKVEEIALYLFGCGVEVVTIFAFSTENWGRPEEEVEGLFELFRKAADETAPKLLKKRVKIRFIGDRDGLHAEYSDVRELMEKFEEESALIENPVGTLVVAINYGGLDEARRAIARIVKKFARVAVKDVLARFPGAHPTGVLVWEFEKAIVNLAEAMDEDTLFSSLDTAGLPNVDLVIRTAGEERLSGFLPLQASYAEYYRTLTPWPAMTTRHIRRALDRFGARQRKFGKLLLEPKEENVPSRDGKTTVWP